MHNQMADFICHAEITATLQYANENKRNAARIDATLRRAKEKKGLDHREASLLLACELPEQNAELLRLARQIKEEFYGKRIVLFAPLYLSNYCVNGCVYCPFHVQNTQLSRRKLTQEEIAWEVVALQNMGHKRIAIEAGEDPVHNPINYILESLDTIYSVKHNNGAIRRANVNIAATTVENYRKLRNAKIGTYILFQETYHRERYKALHPTGPKSGYDWHTTAMDRAMQAGIDDVGLGVLFGLENYRYELAGLLMHAEHLESRFGVGPHTISVPRVKPAEGVNLADFQGIPDDVFAKLIACIRVAVPYTGMIISTRENQNMRARGLELGISQISGASKTSVGGYTQSEASGEQFSISDDRTLDEIVRWLIDFGYIPSFCTACYRQGRTGDRFMELCKTGQLQNICQPNALMTLQEFLQDYASPPTHALGEKLISRELSEILSNDMRELAAAHIEKIKLGQRDFRV